MIGFLKTKNGLNHWESDRLKGIVLKKGNGSDSQDKSQNREMGIT